MNEKIMKRVEEHYKILLDKGYEIIYLGLQGSQNYGLDVYDSDYKSDVDTKAIVLPSFEDFIENKEPISTTLVLDNNEHIDVKDIRVMFDNFKKQNINFIEILFTEYYICNPKYSKEMKKLLENNERIARYNTNQALRCMSGMSMEKLKALQHPYPSIVDKIEKYGYDPKQLHHILRLNDFIGKYVENKPYQECLIPNNIDYLIDVKKGNIPCNIAIELANAVDLHTKMIKDSYVTEIDTIDQDVEALLHNVKTEILKKKFREDLKL